MVHKVARLCIIIFPLMLLVACSNNAEPRASTSSAAMSPSPSLIGSAQPQPPSPPEVTYRHSLMDSLPD